MILEHIYFNTRLPFKDSSEIIFNDTKLKLKVKR